MHTTEELLIMIYSYLCTGILILSRNNGGYV